GDFRLANARLAFQKERAAHPQREEDDGRQPPVGDVALAEQRLVNTVDGVKHVALYHLSWLNSILCPLRLRRPPLQGETHRAESRGEIRGGSTGRSKVRPQMAQTGREIATGVICAICGSTPPPTR